MRISPNFSIERQRRILPYKNPDDFERRVEGMRKAGLTVQGVYRVLDVMSPDGP